MCDFIFEHGVNQWNYLPEKEVIAHLQSIATRSVRAVVAESNGQLLGFVTFYPSNHLSRYQSEERRDAQHGYVCEAVVHHEYSGRGLGTLLLQKAVECLSAQGFNEIYVERHEENAASAGMMRKAGFEEIDTFIDPEWRRSGSRRTTVCRRILDS